MTELGDPSLSVWIVNYNSAGFLANCIAGLGSVLIREIIVLDNASEPDDRRAVQTLAAENDNLTLITSEVNLGFGAGHNRIAELTRRRAEAGDLIWILNPDTIVDPATVDSLCVMVARGEAEIISPTILTGKPMSPVIWYAGGEIDTRRGRAKHIGAGRTPQRDAAASLTPTAFVTGAAPMMSRATWDRLGGFSGDLFLYWEDVDMSLRAQRLGIRLAVAGQLSIWHAEGGASGTLGISSTAYYYTSRNRIIVCSQFGRPVGLVIGRGFPVLLRLAAVAFFKGRRRRWANLWAVIIGTAAGLRGRTGVAR